MELRGASSSALSERMDGGLLSVLPWPCRRGGGAAGFLCELEVVSVLLCDVERSRDNPAGGVGGRGLVVIVAIDSGTLPAASASNGETTSSSPDGRSGGAGKGLFTSEPADDGCVSECVLDFRLGAALAVFVLIEMLGLAGFFALLSAPNSILISFPCLELGGGGGFRPDDGCAVAGGEADGTVGTPGSYVSCDVLGISCMVSYCDWREELASIKLVPSRVVAGCEADPATPCP